MNGLLRAYWAIVSARFRMLLQYRAAALAGMATQLFWGLILTMIYEGFYRSTTKPQPMSYQQVVTYVWLGQAMLAMLPWNLDRDVRDVIRNGNVAYELLRPLDLYWFWYARALAWRLAPTLLRSLPIAAVALLFLGMQPPASPACALAWGVTTVGALLLGCAISTLMAVSLFWTVSGDGIAQLIPALVLVLSGQQVPLPLFPAWAQKVLEILPFSGLIDTPFRLYMGHLPATQTLLLLLRQLAWTAAFVVLGRWMLARGLRRVAIQGG
jgi:ABC-2 type transport system permease protein